MRIACGTVPARGPIGPLTVGVTPDGIAWLSFDAVPEGLSQAARRLGADLVDDPEAVAPAVRQLGEYLDGSRRDLDLPVDWSLTSGAQRAVLMTLYESVGYGETITYGALAARSGAFRADPEHPERAEYTAARAVGSIMGSNPVPVVVPCHRVLATDGLGGFGGGLDVKRRLLELEGVLTAELDFGT